jgi:hypothetical protein
MHNCKETRERFTELALDGGDCGAEKLLDQCEECRAELESLAATLRMTTRLRETVTPPETYWTGYHEQLRGKLEQFHAKAQRPNKKAQREELKPGLGFILASSRQALRLCVKTFLRPVPVPLGVALFAVSLVLMVFSIRPAPQVSQPQAPVVVVQPPMEAATVQDKVVTRIVYRDRWRTSKPAKRVVAGPQGESTIARSQKPQPEDTLSGFKPTDEVKLTVIKGGPPNEK